MVIGNGNVAIDVARMLVLDPDELAATDTADHAIEALGEAGSTRSILLGRRGPAQAAFTNPELRELGELARADVIVDPGSSSTASSVAEDEPTHRTPQRRDPARATPSASRPASRTGSSCASCARRVEILGEGEDGPVTGVRVVRNRHRADATGGRARGADRRGGDHRVRAGAALDRLPRRAGRRRAVRRAPRADPQRRRPRHATRPARAAAASTPSAGSSAARRA